MALDIRDATVNDAPAITEITNELLDTTTFTWTEQPQTAEERRHVIEARHARGFPTLVAVDTDTADILGFASYADFRDSLKWPGYRFTVEHSVNVRRNAWRVGLGKMLMLALLERAQRAGVHVMVGGIDGSNTRSIDFHARLGFREVARMPEAGWKHDHWCDLVLMQKFVDGAGTRR